LVHSWCSLAKFVCSHRDYFRIPFDLPKIVLSLWQRNLAEEEAKRKRPFFLVIAVKIGLVSDTA